MTTAHDDYDDKPSWSEIDKRRDRSQHVSDDPAATRPKSPKKEWAQKMYLKEIENLFKGKKATKEHSMAIETMHARAGTKKFNTEAKKYIKEYGLPDDWSTLFLMLDYKDIKVAKQAITQLKSMFREQPLNIQEGFKSKLNIMAMTASEDELREAAEEALEDW